MTIYTIIVTYNATPWIERCLHALRNSSINTNILIIDNASTDNTLSYLRQQDDIILMPQTNNLGFGQANNIGIRYALNHKADYILLLNQDAYIEPNMIEKLLMHHDNKHLLTPVHMNGDGSAIDKIFCYTLTNANLQADLNFLTDSTYHVGDTAAACWFIPKSLIQIVGCFNPLFFQYGEDNNFYQRMIYHHLGDIILVPSARVYHDRELHGNIQLFKQGLLHREILLAITDINIKWFKCINKLLRVLISCYRNYRYTHYKFGAYTKEIIWIINNYSKIKTSRSTERSNGAWIVP